MLDDVLDLSYKLSNCIKEDAKYKRLNELNIIINDKYSDLLSAFNKAKENYQEALKYGKYHPSLSDYEKRLSESKAELYNKDEVKEYNKLYNEFQEELDRMFNEIKQSVSNKLPLTKSFKGGFKHGCKK